MKDKYPKAWADFEKWFHSWDNVHINNQSIIDYFLLKPFEMQLGVYLSYFKTNRLHLEDEAGMFSSVGVFSSNDQTKNAIEQAFKIREKQLTNQNQLIS